MPPRSVERGISPIFSAILLTLIVLSVGAYVVIYAISHLNYLKQQMSSSEERLIFRFSQSIALLSTYINNGVLYVLMSTGDTYAVLKDIYVNDTLYTSNCLVSIDGSAPTPFRSGIYVAPHTFVAISCSIGTATFAKVTVVYGGGEVVAYAKAS